MVGMGKGRPSRSD